MRQKDEDSVDSDETALSGSVLFAQTNLSKNLRMIGK